MTSRVIECQLIFAFKLPTVIIADRSKIPVFLTKYDYCNNLFSSFLSCPYRFRDMLVRSVALLIIDAIGYKLYVRKFVNAFRFVVLYCIVVYFYFLFFFFFYHLVMK